MQPEVDMVAIFFFFGGGLQEVPVMDRGLIKAREAQVILSRSRNTIENTVSFAI